jgi:hypothetical protein
MPDCYYLDGSRNQQGPVPAEEIARLIRSGTIRRDTLIWYAGMPDWRPAGQVNEFAPLFAQAGPPRPPAAFPPQARGQPQASGYPAAAPARMMPVSADSAPTDCLNASFPVWGLFWRVLVSSVGSFLVIPAPWLNTMVYRFTSSHISLPDGRRLRFFGNAGDIWYVLMALPLLSVIGIFFTLGLHVPAWIVTIIRTPLTVILLFLIYRWFTANLGSEDGSVKLAFTGGFWGFVGWWLLVFLSFYTIIGWAWALRYTMRWVCRNVHGTLSFEFIGTGWGILWRTFAFSLGSIFLIPIPWLLRWYSAWFVSQLHVEDFAAHFD